MKLTAALREKFYRFVRRLPFPLRRGLLLRQDCYFPMGATVCVEIAQCNLKCVMCPRGGMHGLKNERRGQMAPELFKRIINKFLDEKVEVAELWFADWGEPLLNPDFPEMARCARALLPGAKLTLFTNLTCLPDAEAVAGAGLDIIEVSLSGMTQEVYARNHVGGDLARVLAHLDALDAARKRLGSATEIALKFHQYVYNAADSAQAEALARERGFIFKPIRCYISSVEGNAAFQREKDKFSGFYAGFIDMARERAMTRTLPGPRDCIMKRSMVTIDFDGRLYPCCGVYEEKNLMGSIFDVKILDIPALTPPVCRVCADTPISWR